VVLTIMLGLLSVPVLDALVQMWWSDPDSSHGFLVPVITDSLIWSRRESLLRMQVQASAWGSLRLLAGGFLPLTLGDLPLGSG